MEVRVAVIYYSATGNVHGLAGAVAEGAEQAGAEVRLRHVEELASELMISQSQYWGRHRSQVAEAPVATLDDLEWADGVAFGSPTRGMRRPSAPTARRSWRRSPPGPEPCRRRAGRCPTWRGASPGTPSTTPGRSRTACRAAHRVTDEFWRGPTLHCPYDVRDLDALWRQT